MTSKDEVEAILEWYAEHAGSSFYKVGQKPVSALQKATTKISKLIDDKIGEALVAHHIIEHSKQPIEACNVFNYKPTPVKETKDNE